MNLTKSTIFIPIAALLLAGCASTEGYKKPISDFQNASLLVTDSARTSFTSVNKILRDDYIDQHVIKGKEITTFKLQEWQIIFPDELDARLEALDTLATYGKLLGQLANSDVPETITGNADGLATSLNILAENIAKLDGNRNEKFKSTFGPFTHLVGEVARLVVERQISDALPKAIKGGSQPIRGLIEVIREDLEAIHDAKLITAKKSIEFYVGAYEEERKKGSGYPILKQRGDEIKSALDIYDALFASDPNEALGTMERAYLALETYAASPRKDVDLAVLTEQMKIFVARAKRMADAVRDFQEKRNN